MLRLKRKLKRIARRIKRYIKVKRDQRFLKKHGCKSWKQYHRRYDPDICYPAREVKSFYHGYQHVYCIPNDDQGHFAYTMTHDYGPGGIGYGYFKIMEWCEQNCQGKYRADFHRVLGANMNEYEFNDIGGMDHLFFAFKDERDYIMFALRWS